MMTKVLATLCNYENCKNESTHQAIVNSSISNHTIYFCAEHWKLLQNKKTQMSIGVMMSPKSFLDEEAAWEARSGLFPRHGGAWVAGAKFFNLNCRYTKEQLLIEAQKFDEDIRPLFIAGVNWAEVRFQKSKDTRRPDCNEVLFERMTDFVEKCTQWPTVKVLAEQQEILILLGKA